MHAVYDDDHTLKCEQRKCKFMHEAEVNISQDVLWTLCILSLLQYCLTFFLCGTSLNVARCKVGVSGPFQHVSGVFFLNVPSPE